MFQGRVQDLVRDDKPQEENPVVMLSLLQHLIKVFLPFADMSFIPVRRAGFSDAFLIKNGGAKYGVKEVRFKHMLGSSELNERIGLIIKFYLTNRNIRYICYA